jgi:cAMP phosphodiesterase
MSDDSHYPSLAYFIRHTLTEHQFLFFGDVEPDSISGSNTTREVWRAAAPLIVQRKLNTIFLECSWTNDRKDSQLYGHLSPRHFVQELRALADEVVRCQEASSIVAVNGKGRGRDSPPPMKRRKSVATNASKSPLKGLKVYVIHFKEPMEDTDDPRPIYEVITSEIEELVKATDLGVEVIAAEQGMRICALTCRSLFPGTNRLSAI